MNSKQKNIALVIAFFSILFLIYNFVITNTFDLSNQKSQLLKEKKTLDNASEKIIYLKDKERVLDSILKKNNLTPNSSYQQLLLKKVTRLSKENKIDIIEFNEPHSVLENKVYIETYSFKLKGNYLSLLKLINTLEKAQMGELISVAFEKKKNYRLRRDFLTVKVFLQRVKS